MDLLLEHQNRGFNQFCLSRGSFLQETDQRFRLHALLVDALANVRHVINQVIIRQEQKGWHPNKDSSFDILSLAD